MNDRFKFRVFDKETEKYYKSRISKGSGCVVYQHPSSGHCQWVQISTIFAELEQDEKIYARTGVEPETIIEQCTGLKDKNGNLIYIGDIIKCGNGPLNTATVEYANGENFIDGIYPFNLYHDCGDECHCQLRDYPEYACEIIGNIHEQAEQKDK